MEFHLWRWSTVNGFIRSLIRLWQKPRAKLLLPTMAQVNSSKRWCGRVRTSGLDVDELGGGRLAGLRRPPVIDVGDLVHAGDSAVRGTGFLGEVFALQVGFGVLRERNPWIAALLRAIVHQPVFTNVQEA